MIPVRWWNGYAGREVGVTATRATEGANTWSYEPISILGFLNMFKMAWDDNGINDADTMWLLPYFKSKSVAS